MTQRSVLTNVGREYIARWMGNRQGWSNNGYNPLAYHSWGEGGFKVVNGIREPKDPANFVGNTDLEIVLNPGNYTTTNSTDYASGYRPIDYGPEAKYLGGADQEFRITLRLEPDEAYDAGTGQPTYFEVGLYDNAGDVAGDPYFSSHPDFTGGASQGRSGVQGGGTSGGHNLMVYVTFAGAEKPAPPNGETFDIRLDFPMNP